MKIPALIDFTDNTKREVFDSETPEYKALMALKDEGSFKLYQNQQLATGSSVGYNASEDIFFTQPDTFEKNAIKEFALPQQKNKKSEKQILQDDEEDIDADGEMDDDNMDDDVDIEIGDDELDRMVNGGEEEDEDMSMDIDDEEGIEQTEEIEPVNNNQMQVVSIDDLKSILQDIMSMAGGGGVSQSTPASPINSTGSTGSTAVTEPGNGPLQGGKEALKKVYFQGEGNETLDSEFAPLDQNIQQLESHIDGEKPYVSVIGGSPNKNGAVPQPGAAALGTEEDASEGLDYDNPSGCIDDYENDPAVDGGILSDIDKLMSNAPDESFTGNEVPQGASRLVADLPTSDDFDPEEEDYDHDEDTELLLDEPDMSEQVKGDEEETSGMMEAPGDGMDFKNPDLDRFGVGDMDYSDDDEEVVDYSQNDFEPDYEEKAEPAISMNRNVNVGGQPVHIILTGVMITMPEISHIGESVKKAGNKLTKIEGKNNELKIIVETDTKRYTINYVDQPRNKTKTPFSINKIQFQSLEEALDRINYSTEKQEHRVFNKIITEDILRNEVSGPKGSTILEGYKENVKSDISTWSVMPVGVLNLKTGLNETFSRITQSGKEPNTLVLTESGNYYLLRGNLKERSKVGTNKELVYLKEKKSYGTAKVVGIYGNDAAGLGEIMYKIKRTAIPLMVWK